MASSVSQQVSDKVHVAIRMRPLLSGESENESAAWKVVDDSISLQRVGATVATFTFGKLRSCAFGEKMHAMQLQTKFSINRHRIKTYLIMGFAPL